jgi:transmembrane secretion effector
MPALLASSAYRRLWAARTVSQCGDIARFTALTLLVFHLTGSVLDVSGVVIAEIVLVLLLAPVAGPLVDRLPRVTVMIGADLARMALATVLAIWHGDIALVYGAARPLVDATPDDAAVRAISRLSDDLRLRPPDRGPR